MGSGISVGGQHKYSHLAVLVAGRAGGSLTLRGHINFKGDRPLAALWLTLAQKAGLKNERFADIKGVLKELTQAGPRAWTQAFTQFVSIGELWRSLPLYESNMANRMTY